MIILQFFHISTKGCLGGDHKHMLLDFRNQTGGLFKTGVWIFSSNKLTKFGPFRQFFNSANKEKLFRFNFSTDMDTKWKVRIPAIFGGERGGCGNTM